MSRRSSTPSTDHDRRDDMTMVLSVAQVPAVMPPQDPFLNTDDACGYLGVPKATLLTWRVRRPGYGPRAVKAGGRLKYRLSELERWLRAHEDSFAENEPPRPPGPGVVRNRNRASRVSGTAPRAGEPDGAA